MVVVVCVCRASESSFLGLGNARAYMKDDAIIVAVFGELDEVSTCPRALLRDPHTSQVWAGLGTTKTWNVPSCGCMCKFACVLLSVHMFVYVCVCVWSVCLCV